MNYSFHHECLDFRIDASMSLDYIVYSEIVVCGESVQVNLLNTESKKKILRVIKEMIKSMEKENKKILSTKIEKENLKAERQNKLIDRM